MMMIIKLFLVYSSIIGGFIRDSQSFADESNRGLNTAATPAKRKNLATCDGTSPGKPRGINESPASGILRSPGGRAQIVGEISGKKGTMWRTVVPEQADDNERRGILTKRRKADSVFASKKAKGLFMSPEEKAAEKSKNAERARARLKR
jgi:hypothetical protein